MRGRLRIPAHRLGQARCPTRDGGFRQVQTVISMAGLGLCRSKQKVKTMESSAALDSSGEASALHQALVDQLKRSDCLRTPSVEAAFRAVPRHLFLPDRPLDLVYSDE